MDPRRTKRSLNGDAQLAVVEVECIGLRAKSDAREGCDELRE